MLKLFRRHTKTCPHRKKGRAYAACDCPIWVYAFLQGKEIRSSVGTTSWQHALKWLQEQQGTATREEAVRGKLLADAAALYLADCEERQLAEGTLEQYDNSLTSFANFCHEAKRTRVHQVDLETVRGWRGTMKMAPASIRKQIEHIRTFFRFCIDNNWCDTNPALRVKPPKETRRPTLPFSDDEVQKLLAACDLLDNQNPAWVEPARRRARALVLLLVYSGLRIEDAVTLERSRLQKDGRLHLRQAKTGEPVYLELHPQAIAALKALPEAGAYFLWSGNGKVSSVKGSARRTIAKLGELAGVPNCHPHRFRDTFSIGLLRKGVDIRDVQLLLGHTSIRTTERHYAPFVASLQGRLNKAVRKLDFGIAPGKTGVNAGGNRKGDAQVLPFSRRRRRA